MYYILQGNNGATYIVNVNNMDSIMQSLKFYKARTLKQRIMKNALKIYLNILSLLHDIFSLRRVKSKNEIEQYLKDLMDQSMNYELDENSSVLVSPTRDKIIVNHHDYYFHKFAFGKSYEKVHNEAKIYALLNTPLQFFNVSKMYDIEDDGSKFCSFKLCSHNNSTKTDIDITLALVELFNNTRQDGYRFSTYLEGLKKRYEKSGVVSNAIERLLEKIEDTHKDTMISLGLVHRDFKPWNINDEQGLLIYDFEEAVTDGLPLEDLLNYYVDPIVRYLPSAEVDKQIFDDKRVKEYKRYLKELQTDLDFEVLLGCYLVERTVF